MAKQTKRKMSTKKMVAKSDLTMKHECACGNDCMCGCHKHGFAHVVKHIIVWAIIFALGMACGKMIGCGHHKKMHRKMQPVFMSGCLDMTSIKCPKMSEDIIKADVNGDNCISVEEFKAWKRANKQNTQPKHKGGHDKDQGMRPGFRHPNQ